MPEEQENKPVEVQAQAPAAHEPAPDSRLSKLKVAFLYVLIGGISASAIIAVVALLIGDFNAAIGKSLLTILILFSHSLFILAILWADRYNQVGRLVLPTTIIGLAFANLITTTLGTWEIISNDTAWRCLGLYFLILGAAFIISSALRLRLNHQATKATLYSSIGLISATILTLSPWVLNVVDNFDPLYFRIVAALSILATTSFLIALVIRGIAVGRKQGVKETAPKPNPASGGMLAIYITVGSIAAMVWFGGLITFAINGIQSTTDTRSNKNTTNYY